MKHYIDGLFAGETASNKLPNGAQLVVVPLNSTDDTVYHLAGIKLKDKFYVGETDYPGGYNAYIQDTIAANAETKAEWDAVKAEWDALVKLSKDLERQKASAQAKMNPALFGSGSSIVKNNKTTIIIIAVAVVAVVLFFVFRKNL